MPRASATTLESECTLAERAALTAVLRDKGYTGAHLEVGTAAGGTLKELMGVYDADSRPPFFVVDPMTYFDDQLAKVKTNLTGAGIDPETVTFWIGTTEDHLPLARAAGQRFDFIFLDGDHRHYPTTVDLGWADLVTPGGTICLHDRTEKFPGVGWSIDHFLDRNPAYRFVSQTDSLVILEKTAEATRQAVTTADLWAASWAQRKFKTARSIRRRLGR
jgi:hypothetical protein